MVSDMTISEADIWRELDDVKDPEIPAISVVELGIVRRVEVVAGKVNVTMTPTFSGCPAIEVMKREVESAVRRLGADDVGVEMVLYPPWTSEWISESGREKLRDFGLAPPPRHQGNVAEVAFFDLAECPYCGSTNTSLRNAFGPTLCRMTWYCHDCRDAFEQFKAL